MNKNFKLSSRSKGFAADVNPDLVFGLTKALTCYSTVDIGFICGTRTLDEQKKNIALGLSETLASSHIPMKYKRELLRTKEPVAYKDKEKLSHAIDVMAYDENGKGTWESKYYYAYAEAVRLVAIKYDLPIIWGGCWKDIRKVVSIKAAVDEYVDRCVKRNKKPFLDIGHFHLQRSLYS